MTAKRTMVLAAIVLCGAVWIATIVASGAGWNPFQTNWDFTNTGAFGDSFGPLSAAMAAVAATAALLAWQGQVEETERARASEQSAREDALATRDEATLFQLIGLLRQVVSAIDIHLQSGKIKTGHDAIAHILRRVVTHDKGTVSSSFVSIYNDYRNDLGHYFRLSYNIFSFISRSHLNDKQFYTRIARALYSDSELALIALNCAYGEGKRKFKPLVEEFCLLNNISEQMITTFELRDLFDGRAFDRS